MNINVHLHVPPGGLRIYLSDPNGDVRHREILTLLHELLAQGDHLMSKADDIKSDLAEVKTIVVEVAGDLDEVLGKLDGGVSADEAVEIQATIRELRDQLRGVGDKVPEPVEPPPPVPEG